MRLVNHFLGKYREVLSGYRFIVVQHLMNDTKELIEGMVDNGIEVFSVFAKSYSLDECCAEKMKELGVKVEYLTNDESKDYLNCRATLKAAMEKCAEDGKKVIILDLGGEYARILCDEYYEDVFVSIEDTAIGHRRYEQFSPRNTVYSVAQSKMKEIEARFVGSSVVNSAEAEIRKIGKSLYANAITLFGYGLIGRNVAVTLKNYGCRVDVCDIDKVKLLDALFDGYSVSDVCHKYNPIIFGATGVQSVRFDSLERFCDETYLISGSSRQVEFDIETLKEKADKICELDENIVCYEIDNKKFYLFYDGYPVNFLNRSIPDSIIDFMFSEMILAVIEAIDETVIKHTGINVVSKNGINEIADAYLNI